MPKQFDYQGAKQAGYSDEEIMSHLAEIHPKFDIQEAQKAGYSPEEINQHLSTYKKERSVPEKGLRLAAQGGLGILGASTIPLEIASMPLESKQAQHAEFRKGIFEDIERLTEQKQTGVWDQQDETLLNELVDQVKNPEKAEKYVKTATISPVSLIEEAADLHPEGVLEHAARWTGFLKNPKNAKELIKLGTNPKELMKAIIPGKDAMRGLGAGVALQLAEDGNFGPIGTMAAAVVGDLIGGGVTKVAKTIASPKKALVKGAAKLVPSEKLELQKGIIQDFRDAGIQADLGTITDSNLVKMVQSRLSQSGLAGKELDEFRKTLMNEIKEQYKKLADGIGEARFATSHEASEVGKEYLTEARNVDKAKHDQLYAKSRASLKENASVNPTKLAAAVSRIEKELLPGSVKSEEQDKVLKILDKLKKDMYDPDKFIKPMSVQEAMNNKSALSDIINYESQGGQTKLLKQLVHELDKTIISHGQYNKEFLKNYAEANKKFAEHAKTFRNQNINKILTSQDPSILMNKMNSVQGMRDLKKALGHTAEGKKAFDDLKRLKLDQMIGHKMTDNVSEQVKLGTFSNLLKSPKDKQLALEILGPEAFKHLQRLQKSAGKLEQTAQKFLNASKSGTVAVDAAVIAKGLHDLGHVLVGNPWPLAKTLGGIAGARYVAKLMADPKFLKDVEEAILASQKNETAKLMQIGKRLEAPIKAAISSQ